MKQEITLEANLIDGRFKKHFILFYFKFSSKIRNCDGSDKLFLNSNLLKCDIRPYVAFDRECCISRKCFRNNDMYI